MIALQNVYTNVTGTHPNVLAVDSSGAATPDGTEFIAAGINNESFGFVQALMDWANGGTNSTSSVGVPNGVTEAAGTSQLLDAIQKGHAIGPGYSYIRYIEDSPAVWGDRAIELAEQGVLVSSYPDLDAACYCGDASNATRASGGGKFYRSSDAAGATPNIAGPYIQLPANLVPGFLKQYSEAAGDFTVTGTGWTTVAAVTVPYKTIDGSFRLMFNFVGSVTASSRAAFTITVSGITIKTGVRQTISTHANTGLNAGTMGYGDAGAATLNSQHGTASTSQYEYAGNIELDSWPTWADSFEPQWVITY